MSDRETDLKASAAIARVRMRHLRCFLAVARTGSVTRAAEEMKTVQPSISRTIREFEEEIGYPVFDRTPSGLELNAAGQLLYRHVSDGMHRIVSGIEATRNRETGEQVIVYALPNVIRTIMPETIARFKELRPDVDISIPSISSINMPELLRRGEIDFAFGRLQSVERMKGLEFEPLFSEPLVWCVRKGHPLGSRRSVSVSDLSDYNVVLPIRNTIIRQEIDQYLASKGIMRFPNLIETISFEFGRAYMQISDAIVLMPRGAMISELKSGSVVGLPTGDDQLMGAVGITTASEYKPSAPSALLMELIREQVERELRVNGEYTQIDIPRT